MATITRRSFVQRSVTALAASQVLGANNTIRLALIGCSSQGNGDSGKRLNAIAQSATAVIAR
jgi:hypothetical protein